MSRPRRKLTALDDPLGEAGATTKAVPARRGESSGTQALFVRVPAAQGDALARAAFELRLHKQEIVAALIARHVDTSAEGLDAVLALVSEYRGSRG
jgi:hypothetical protein